MIKVDWRERSLVDIEAIVLHIAKDNPRAARSMRTQIEVRALSLNDNPKMGRPGRVQGTRELIIRASEMVVYRKTPTAITILRVIHTSRRWPPRAL